MLIDTHAHLSSSLLQKDLEEVLSRAKQSNIQRVINICTDEASLIKGLEIHKKHPWILNAAATTPHDVEKDGEYFFPLVEKQAKSNNLVAIGETGLDYFYEHSPKEKQKEFLLRYFALALETNLPLIIHCRDAFDDLFTLADQYYPSSKLVVHCFTGTADEAKEAVKRGWKVSFSGILTFKKSVTLRDAAACIPLENTFIETDTPYLAPQLYRGQENEPAFVVETARVLADIHGVDFDTIALNTTQNAIQFFSLSKPTPCV